MSHVKRSTYQKVVEKNKKLKNDIKILVAPTSMQQLLVKRKWRLIFEGKQRCDILY